MAAINYMVLQATVLVPIPLFKRAARATIIWPNQLKLGKVRILAVAPTKMALLVTALQLTRSAAVSRVGVRNT